MKYRFGRSRNSLNSGFEKLEPRMVLSSDPLISEFMAINDSTLADGDGDYPDWIEIHNPTDTIVNLDGWYLTDDSTNLTKWSFPDTEILPGGYQIVFASDKNSPSLNELHTNFKLIGSGEYLALVKPDAITTTTEFNPFPPQIADVSYGFGSSTSFSPIVSAADPLKYQVPSDGSDGQLWTDLGFDDSAWSTGNGGVGFDLGSQYDSLISTDIESTMHTVNPGVYTRQEFLLANPDLLDTLALDVQYDDGFVAYLNGQEVARRNAPVTQTTGLAAYYDFNSTNPYDDKSGNGADGSAGINVAVDNDSPLGDSLGESLTNGGSSSVPDEIVTVPQVDAPNFGTSDFSIAFWLRWDNAADSSLTEGIFDALAGITTGYQAFVFDTLAPSGTVRLRLDDDQGGFALIDSSAGAIPSDGTWHHVVFSIDRDDSLGAKVYIDGVLSSSSDPTDVSGTIAPSQDLWCLSGKPV